MLAINTGNEEISISVKQIKEMNMVEDIIGIAHTSK